VDGETGLLARGSDPAHLAVQIERLLLDEPLRARLARAGAAHVQALFAPGAAVAAYEELYREMVRLRAGAAAAHHR
jgi:glycosyltransferase involved in cell wall biosynthesis